jgi:hypothetical protein
VLCRLTYADLSTPSSQGGLKKTAQRWDDTVGIGIYWFADIHKMNASVCAYPAYLKGNAPVLPYYIPFRALTVDKYPNLLVAGKSIAATFYANAALRLHPMEWATGAAAGAAAAFAWANGGMDALKLQEPENMRGLQRLLEGNSVGAPLEWSSPQVTSSA